MKRVYTRTVVALLLPLLSALVPAPLRAQNLTVTITKIDDSQSTVTAQPSLQAAMDTYPLEQVQGLEISGGTFNTADWGWLQTKRDLLDALTRFTITAEVTAVADIPDVLSAYNAYFSSLVKEVAVAKAIRIGKNAFSQCAALRSISFPDATSVGNGAFHGCASLATASLPQAITVGEQAFYGCLSLPTVNLPQATTVGFEAFWGCSSLISVGLPKAAAIENRMFVGCTALSLVHLPEATSIGDEAFYGCTALAMCTMPRVSSIGEFAFAHCTSMTNLQPGGTPPTVGNQAFFLCPSPRYMVPVDAAGVPLTDPTLATANASYKAVDDGSTADAFWYGWTLGVTLHAIVVNPTTHGAVSTPRHMPAGQIVEVFVSPNPGYMLQTLSATAASGTELPITDLRFTMPSNDVTISATFAPNALGVTVNGTEARTGVSLEAILGDPPLNHINSLDVTGGWLNASDWEWLRDNRNFLTALTRFSVEDGVAGVSNIPNGSSACFGPQLQTVSVPKVAAIGRNALKGCTSLTAINFPKTSSIEDYAFANCAALTSVIFPAATLVGHEVFWSCEALTTVSLPKAQSIGEAAFEYCEVLTNLQLGAIPPTVGNNAFENCPSLRYLGPVDATGTPLTGSALATANAAYKAVDDGSTADELWYGWTLGQIQGTTHTITVNAGPNGTVAPNGAVFVIHGASQNFAITANAGFVIDELKEDGVAVPAAAGQASYTHTLANVTASHTIDATFRAATHTITVNAGPNGTAAPSGTLTVAHGGSQSFAITANAGFVIDELKLDGAAVPAAAGQATYTLELTNVTANRTIDATFRAATHTITVNTGPNGTAAPSGTLTVAHGGSQSISITASTGFVIDELKLNGATVTAAAGKSTYTLELTNVTASHTIDATFRAATYTITVNAGANGTAAPSGTLTVAHGGSQNVSITANAGFVIDELKLDGAAVPAAAGLATYILELTNVTANRNVDVTFKRSTGIEQEDSTPALELYPNPVRHGFYVEANEGGQLLRVFNPVGVEVLQQRISGKTYIDLSAHPAGVYLVRVGHRTARLVKQ